MPKSPKYKSSLTMIPFQNGSMPAILASVCALFSFLVFFCLSFAFFFKPPAALISAQTSKGYVIVLPKDSDAKLADRLPSDVKNEALKDAMSFLSHMLSYMDDVISHKEFQVTDYSPLFRTLSEVSTDDIFVDIKMDRDAKLNTYQFKRDVEGIFPGATLVDRQVFFKDLADRLETLAAMAGTAGLFMFVALALVISVLMNGAFSSHQKTLQTLRYMGTLRSTLKQQFLSFFKNRFMTGTAIGFGLALFAFIPFAYILDQTLTIPSLFLMQTGTLIGLSLLGYILLSAMVRTVMTMKCKALA